MWTYQDQIDSLVDFIGGGPSDQVIRSLRQSVMEAYREMPRAHRWPYLYHHGRIMTTAPYNGSDPNGTNPPATITYDHTGGQYERMVTISGATWPGYAAACYIRLANPPDASNPTAPTDGIAFVAYRVKQRVSATILILDEQVNPGSDIASGTSFILYQDTYLLPADYIAQDQALYEQNFGGMKYTHPREWLYENRYVLAQGTPQFFTVTGDPQYPGKLVMRVFPWPSDVRSIDFIYQRSPRPLFYQQFTGGSVSATSGGETVTATGFAFTPNMVGSVIRISGNARLPSSPTGAVAGYNPPILEAIINSWVSPTVVGIDTESPAALVNCNYYISDPIDFEQGAMLNAFMRCCEKCSSVSRALKGAPMAISNYQRALEEARSASSTSFAGRHAGQIGRYQPRLRDYPQGPDQS